MKLLKYDEKYDYFIHNVQMKETNKLSPRKKEMQFLWNDEVGKIFQHGFPVVDRKISSTTEKITEPLEEETKGNELLKYLQSRKVEEATYQILVQIPKDYFDYNRTPKPIFRYTGRRDENNQPVCFLDPSFIVGAYYQPQNIFIINHNFDQNYSANGLLYNNYKDPVMTSIEPVSIDFVENDEFRCQFKSHTQLKIYDLLNVSYPSPLLEEEPRKVYRK